MSFALLPNRLLGALERGEGLPASSWVRVFAFGSNVEIGTQKRTGKTDEKADLTKVAFHYQFGFEVPFILCNSLGV